MKNHSVCSQLGLALLFVVFGIQQQSFAQDKFSLKDYQNPDYLIKSLDFSYDLGTNNYWQNSQIKEVSDISQAMNNVNSGLNFTYRSIKNNRKYQGLQTAGLTMNGNWIHSKLKDENLSRTTNNRQMAGLLTVVSENRFYNSTQQFLEIDANISGGINEYKNTQTSDPQNTYPVINLNRNSQYSYSIEVPVLLGKGRIEAVQDARLAVYLLEDLEKAGVLKQPANADETLELARFITLTKNKRHFDSRLRKIAEITSIDSFLMARNLKDASNAAWYTLLNDNWDYANGPVREAGSRFSMGLAPLFSLNNQYSTENHLDTVQGGAEYETEHITQANLHNLALRFMSEYRLEYPINQQWQRSTTLKAGYTLAQSNLLEENLYGDSLLSVYRLDTRAPHLMFQLAQGFGFYPNSRTELTANAIASWNQYWNSVQTEGEEESTANESLFTTGVGCNANYYVSPRLRFTAFLTAQYSFNHSVAGGVSGNPYGTFTDTGFDWSMGGRLIYSLI